MFVGGFAPTPEQHELKFMKGCTYMTSKKTKFFFLSVLTLLLLIILYVGYILNMKTEISNSVLRLHIIGADNSIHAQELKINVRDRILCDFSEIFKNSTSRAEAIILAESYKSEIENAANEELAKRGSTDRASVEIGHFKFPTKTYGNIILPKGRYTALNIKIGGAIGENWWCVMYPPLCISDKNVAFSEESKDKLRQSLSEEEYKLITESKSFDIKVKFRITEILGEFF